MTNYYKHEEATADDDEVSSYTNNADRVSGIVEQMDQVNNVVVGGTAPAIIGTTATGGTIATTVATTRSLPSSSSTIQIPSTLPFLPSSCSSSSASPSSNIRLRPRLTRTELRTLLDEALEICSTAALDIDDHANDYEDDDDSDGDSDDDSDDDDNDTSGRQGLCDVDESRNGAAFSTTAGQAEQ